MIPEVAANIMLFMLLGASVMAQWAVYAIRRDNRRDTAIALALLALFGVAVLNAQIYVYNTMGLDIRGRPFATLVYAVTGRSSSPWSPASSSPCVMAFRTLGGRYSATDHDGISALALYWHFLTVVFSAVWLVVYVVK